MWLAVGTAYFLPCVIVQIVTRILCSGDVNDWQSLFKEDHNQEMDATFEERLNGTKLGEKLNYKKYCKA